MPSTRNTCFTLALPLLVALTLSLAATGPAHAQRGGAKVAQAVAVVQAPESAVEICHGPTVRAAQDCALARCQKKAGRGACYSVTACAPSGWTGVMGVKLKEVHFSESVCGAPSREAVLEALKAFCRGHMPNLEQCSVAQVWAPNGVAQTVDFSWSPTDLRGGQVTQ